MMWRENDVRTHGGGTKHFRHPVAGLLAVEYSAFSIDGRPELSLVIYNPATPEDVNKIRGLLKSEAKPNRGGVATHER
jgi:MmyB-like transcription regulator ligand binding domain